MVAGVDQLENARVHCGLCRCECVCVHVSPTPCMLRRKGQGPEVVLGGYF